MQYPPARRSDAVDSFQSAKTGGIVPVPEPYDWLEDLDSDETKAFVAAQNELLQKYLADPALKEPKIKLLSILQTMLGQVVIKQPPQVAGRYYLVRVAGRGREFPVTLRIRKDLIRGYISPSDTRLNDTAFQAQLEFFHDEREEKQMLITSGCSGSGKYWAYSSSVQGSDCGTIKVKDVENGQVLPDEVNDTRFDSKKWPIIWLGDRGFFYQYWEPQDQKRGNPQLRFHALGRPQAEDEVVYQDAAHPGQRFSITISDDATLAFLHIYETGPMSRVQAARILNNDQAVSDNRLALDFSIDICNNFRSQWEYVGLASTQLEAQDPSRLHLFWTDLDNGQVVGFKLDGRPPVTIIGASQAQTLRFARLVSESRVLAVRSVDVRDQLQVFSVTNGQLLTTIQTTGFCFSDVVVDGPTQNIFVQESSFCYPFSLWHVDGSKIGEVQDVATEAEPLKFFPGTQTTSVSTTQVFYASSDGTKVPMFLTSEVSHKLTPKSPVLLYVYGGHGISVIPHFRPDFLAFIRGFHGVLAIANIRGGGEYGRSWHRAACKEKRQLLFDDIHGAIKHLKSTLGSKTIILSGESMGALNSASAMIQKPELLSAAMLNAGPIDTFRLRKSRGKEDIGDPAIPAEFDSMLKWSPLANVKDGHKYPPVLLMAGDKDELVSYANSCKMTASLQHAGSDIDGNPVHLQITSNLGHGGNISMAKLTQLGLARLLWLKKTLGLEMVSSDEKGQDE